MLKQYLVRCLPALAFVGFLAATSFCQNPIFKAPKIYPSGGAYTGGVAIADLNGDGKLDGVVVDRGGNVCCSNGYVGVLMGNGDGTLQAVSDYYAGDVATTAAAVADVNGDGKPDVLVVNSNTLGVLLGKGDGTLQPAKTYSLGGSFGRALAVADLDGDGKLDVVVDNNSSSGGQISVLMGNGDGSFRAPQIYPTNAFEENSEGNTVALADVNKDGNLDILVAINLLGSCCEGYFGVLPGNGDGTFRPIVTYDAGNVFATNIVAVDLNGDGNVDVITDGNVFLGIGDGTFQPPQRISSQFGGGQATLLADVTRDGILDLLAGDDCNGACGGKTKDTWAIVGNGDGTFQSSPHFYGGGMGAEGIAVGDLNGDGKPDLIVANKCIKMTDCTAGTVGVLLSEFLFTTTTSLSSSPNPSVLGKKVTFTATVTSKGSIAPTGKVTFKYGAKVSTKTMANGVAAFTTAKLPVGSLSITATYDGDTNCAKSTSQVLIQVVNP